MKIALIAHDKKKDEIIELSKQYKDVLANYELYATGTTGTLIMGETALPILFQLSSSRNTLVSRTFLLSTCYMKTHTIHL